ncbi:MAG: dehydrogenase [Paenibacillus sp.]|jgi:D-3-phosphoglycerate dehydrogenase|nr:dehydrogenase [Paenibacillus sp.]
MPRYKVVVTDHGFANLDTERSILEPLGFEVVEGHCRTEAETAALCEQADAVLTNLAPVNAHVISRMSKCKIIVRYGVGYDSVDTEAAADRRIPVVNVPDYGIHEVADHTLALMLSIVRKIPQIQANVRAGQWQPSPCRPIIGLQGKVAGVAGFGNIAKEVAKRYNAMGMKVAAYDPYVDASVFRQHQAEQADWDTLLRESDVLSVHLPLTAATRHLFNKEAFQQMKSTAYIVNTSRGGVVHADDLAEALHSGQIAGAALDVFEVEPIPAGHRLLHMDSCIITSHCAWYSEDSMRRLQEYAALEIKRLFSGETPKHIVNKASFPL